MKAYYLCLSIHLLPTFLPDPITAFFRTQFYSKSTAWHSRVCSDMTLILGFGFCYRFALSVSNFLFIIHLIFFLFLVSYRWAVMPLSLSKISWLSFTYVAFCTVGIPSCWGFELLMQTWQQKLNLSFFLFLSNIITVFQRVTGSHGL